MKREMDDKTAISNVIKFVLQFYWREWLKKWNVLPNATEKLLRLIIQRDCSASFTENIIFLRYFTLAPVQLVDKSEQVDGEV